MISKATKCLLSYVNCRKKISMTNDFRKVMEASPKSCLLKRTIKAKSQTSVPFSGSVIIASLFNENKAFLWLLEGISFQFLPWWIKLWTFANFRRWSHYLMKKFTQLPSMMTNGNICKRNRPIKMLVKSCQLPILIHWGR